MTQQSRLREYATPSAPIRVDAEKGILYDVLFLGHNSRNRADYSREVMEEALPLYEGAQSYVSHTRDGSNPDFDRSFGVPRNCHVAADGIRGDYHFPPSHRLAEQFVWAAQNNPRACGFSHDADCSWTVKNGRKVVHKIDRVYSIDVVTKPGTTSGLFEDEEIIDDAHRQFAEQSMAAMDMARSIIIDRTLAPEDRRTRLLESLNEWHGSLLEGEIGDEMAKDAPRHAMRRMRDIASNHIDESMWSDQKYPTHKDKRDRQVAVLADWSKELKALDCSGQATCPACNHALEEESTAMAIDWKEVTEADLKANRPDLIAVLTGTDEHTRLTEEVTALKATVTAKDAELATLQAAQAKRLQEETIVAELAAAKFPTTDAAVYSATFKEELFAAPDATKRAALIADRMALASGRVQESTFPAPLADLGAKKTDTTHHNSGNASLFGVK